MASLPPSEQCTFSSHNSQAVLAIIFRSNGKSEQPSHSHTYIALETKSLAIQLQSLPLQFFVKFELLCSFFMNLFSALNITYAVASANIKYNYFSFIESVTKKERCPAPVCCICIQMRSICRCTAGCMVSCKPQSKYEANCILFQKYFSECIIICFEEKMKRKKQQIVQNKAIQLGNRHQRSGMCAMHQSAFTSKVLRKLQQVCLLYI